MCSDTRRISKCLLLAAEGTPYAVSRPELPEEFEVVRLEREALRFRSVEGL